MKWFFAKSGGIHSGFHNAGVETFRGNFDRYLARELVQNSLDARLDAKKPVVVKFELVKLKRTSIPDVNCLQDILSRCAKFWKLDKKAHEFFKRAEKLTKDETILALRVGDYNTTGLLGSDTDKAKNWYNLIRCSGATSKYGGEGGSFGIGKYAPFAASQMRTVLYSTFNTDREHIFQGVATVVTHKHPNGGFAEATGYLGGGKGASIRAKSKIPQTFLRKEFGTDIIVLGFPENTEWEGDLVFSILENFWPAIHFGELEANVGSVSITKSNLQNRLSEFSAREEFTAHLYYEAFTKPTHKFTQKLPYLENVSLYLLASQSAGDAEMPKRVTMVRQTGMKIFEKRFQSVVPFCGVFVCRNKVGNKLLREMEPPRHDTWDANHPEKGASKKIESEYVNFIRECIYKLAPTDDTKVISIPGLNKFLPDDDDAPEENFDEAKEDGSSTETLERSPLPEKILSLKLDPRKKLGRLDPNQRGDEEHGKGGHGGKGKVTEGEIDSEREGVRTKPPIPIRYRSFARNLSEGAYAVTIAPERENSKEANLIFFTVGDDQRIPAEIKAAKLPSGETVQVRRGGVVGPVKFSDDSPVKLEITLREPLRVAMEISAYEN